MLHELTPFRRCLFVHTVKVSMRGQRKDWVIMTQTGVVIREVMGPT